MYCQSILKMRASMKLLTLFIFLIPGYISAQYTHVFGTVTDAANGQPLPFVNITFKGKNIGTTTDIDGKFEISSQWASEYLVASFVGYNTKSMKVEIGKKQEINFKLEASVQQLEEVVIRAPKKRYKNKDNPAVILIRNILKYRDENRGKSADYFEYDKYEKDEYDLNNFTEEWTKRKAFKNFQVITNYIDTSDINGKPYIPMLIKEKVSKVYYRNSPRTEREVVEARRISGFENGSFGDGISQFLEKLSSRVDVYENNIDLLDKSFTSPISNIGPNVYRYYITDSIEIEGKKYTELSFIPREPSLIAFTGKMLVADSSQKFAVKTIELNIDKRININFLEGLRVSQEFEKHPEQGWIITKDVMTVDIQPAEKGIGIYNTKTINYKNFVYNKKRPEEFYGGVNQIVESDSAMKRGSNYWDTARFEKLTEKEQGIYDMIDTIQNVPQFQTITNIGEFLLSGYIKKGGLDIGPIPSYISYNDIEGIRLRLGARTNLNFHEKWRFKAFGAYGLNDKKWKYQGVAEYYFGKNPRSVVHLSYTNDIFQPGFEVNWQESDNIFLSFRTGRATNMFYKKEIRSFYEREWFRGFINVFEIKNQEVTPTFQNPLILNGDGTKELKSIKTTQLTLRTRFAINEKFIQGRFERRTIRTTAPIFNLDYSYAPKTLSDFEFHRINLSVIKRFKLGILGVSDTEIEGTKIFGKVPYLLLNVHRGNETFTYDDRSFNMMNFLEFASDESISFMITHHFNGLLVSYLPFLDRMKLRAVTSGKIVYGRISPENADQSDPELLKFRENTTYSLDKEPYAEVSGGVENIFKLLRVEIVKRLTHLDNPKVNTLFGTKGIALRAKIQISF